MFFFTKTIMYLIMHWMNECHYSFNAWMEAHLLVEVHRVLLFWLVALCCQTEQAFYFQHWSFPYLFLYPPSVEVPSEREDLFGEAPLEVLKCLTTLVKNLKFVDGKMIFHHYKWQLLTDIRFFSQNSACTIDRYCHII